ncbi:MAG: alpha/beta fold hydrolase, partial [Gammaproteobacteria bacterium]
MCLSAVRRGLGRPLVLLHGWGSSSRVWRKLSRLLATQFQTTAFDLPGFGLSDPTESIVLSQISDRLLRSIEGRFMILGWSLGGLVALEMARRAPERVAGVVLIAVNPCFVRRYDWVPAIEAGVFESFVQHIAAAPARALRRFAVLQASNGAHRAEVTRELQAAALWKVPESHVLLTTLTLLSKSDMRQVLMGLNCPVALVLGEQDALVPVAIRNELIAFAPRLCCYVVAGAAHAPFLSHPK